jgi:hypothetical protein
MKKISIILINNNRLLCEGIREIIEQQPDLKFMASFGEND